MDRWNRKCAVSSSLLQTPSVYSNILINNWLMMVYYIWGASKAYNWLFSVKFYTNKTVYLCKKVFICVNWQIYTNKQSHFVYSIISVYKFNTQESYFPGLQIDLCASINKIRYVRNNFKLVLERPLLLVFLTLNALKQHNPLKINVFMFVISS